MPVVQRYKQTTRGSRGDTAFLMSMQMTVFI